MHSHAFAVCPQNTFLFFFFPLFFSLWLPHTDKRDDLDVNDIVMSFDEIIFIYKQDIQYSEGDKALGQTVCGLTSQAEKLFFFIVVR